GGSEQARIVNAQGAAPPPAEPARRVSPPTAISATRSQRGRRGRGGRGWGSCCGGTAIARIIPGGSTVGTVRVAGLHGPAPCALWIGVIQRRCFEPPRIPPARRTAARDQARRR